MTNNLLDLVFQSTYLFHRYKIWRSKIYVLMDQLKGGLNLLRHYPPHWRMENWTVINTSSFPIFHKNVAPCPLINFTSIILKKITSQLQRFVSKIVKVLTCHLSKKDMITMQKMKHMPYLSSKLCTFWIVITCYTRWNHVNILNGLESCYLV